MIDTHYAAGFFDGEGCVYIGKNKPRRDRQSASPDYRLYVKIGNTYRAVLEQFRERWGGSIYSYPPKANRRRMHDWAIVSNQAVAFLKDIVALLKEKQLAAKFGIQFQEHRRKQYGGPGRLTEDELRSYEMHFRLVQITNRGY